MSFGQTKQTSTYKEQLKKLKDKGEAYDYEASEKSFDTNKNTFKSGLSKGSLSYK